MIFLVSIFFRSKQIYTYENKKLEDIIEKCSSNSSIQLNDLNLIDNDLEIVVQQAILSKQTKDLSLANNQITSRGAQILSNNLFNNLYLQDLWLTNNQLNDQGIYYLSKSLSINSTLTKLGLSSNNITNLGISYLCQMFKRNSKLKMINLAKNQFDDEGIQLLSNTIAYHNSTLQILTLNRNHLITDKSIHSILNMINKNNSIQQIWLNNCNFTQNGISKLDSFSKTKKHLKLITVYHNS